MVANMKAIVFFQLLALLIICTNVQALDESDFKTEVVEVIRVADGDTLNVKFADNSEEVVRFLAIQAFEEHDNGTGDPDCNAEIATDRLAEILGCDTDSDNCLSRPLVTLKVWDESLLDSSGKRLLRFVFIDDGNGGEINVGLQLVQEGYVLAWPQPEENFYNEDLWLAQQNAMDNQRGPLWNSELSECHNPEHEDAQLDMWVNWDAPGNDGQNLNGEWVKIKNIGPSEVDLSHWRVRDTGQQNPFQFPNGTILSAEETITVYVGEGSNIGNTFYMNENYSIFDNNLPDGAYLLDYWGDSSRAGDIISSFTYPCLRDCSDPLQGKVRIKANYDAEGDDSTNPNGEWVDIRNISNEDVDLLKYRLQSDPVGSAIFNFDENSIIPPNETMRVYIGQSKSSSSLEKYWGNSTSILSNSKDSVWLDTYDGILIDSDSWPVPPPPTVTGENVIPLIMPLILKEP